MGIIDDVVGAIGKGLSAAADMIGDKIITAISNFIGMCLYYLTRMLMWFVWVLQQLFNVFSGTSKVEYDTHYMYLIDVFFQNKSVNNVYWAMTLLGITFVVVFTIIAVVRKTFDINDKHQNQSMGSILGGMFKSILTMLVLSLALSAALNLTNLTINRIGYIFDNADSFSQEKEIHFTDEQYATMARIYKTIGNYSLNPSYTSRYNINSCYNDIRSDLNYLEQQGVFDMVYVTNDGKEEIDTWQSVLQELIYATDTTRELKMDKVYPEVSNALLHIMEVLRTNAKFYPISDYKNGYTVTNGVSLDRILFLSGTVSAARNSKYNENPYLTDGLRGAFYAGKKDIYSFDHVKEAFEIGITGINYIFIWVLTYFTIRNLFRCIFGCIMRIFNMISLYLVAPLAIATMPLDEGEKFKQWTMSMVIQGLTILGMIVPMRLVILFAPIIMSPKLVLFESVTLNFVGKILMIIGGLEAVDGFSRAITGILTNNTAMAALNADDAAGKLGETAFGMTKGAVGAGLSAGLGVAKMGGKAVLATGGALLSGLGSGLYSGAKGINMGINALRGAASDNSSFGGDTGDAIGGGASDTPSGGMGGSDLSEKLAGNGNTPSEASNLSSMGSMDNLGGAGTEIEMQDLSSKLDQSDTDSIINHGDVESFLNGTSVPKKEPLNNTAQGASGAPKKAPPPPMSSNYSNSQLYYKKGYEGGKMKKVAPGEDPLSKLSKK